MNNRMQDFSLWLQMGMEHILDLAGYDHICYVAALAIIYNFRTWKPLLIQVTAFTIGHSLSLAASVLNLVKIPQSVIEVIIPITIMITCIVNIINTIQAKAFAQKANYGLALLFGLVHGLGFSYLLKSMLGRAVSVIAPLFAFNIGLEVGQIVIVSIVIGLNYLIEKSNLIKSMFWIRSVSAFVFLIALKLLLERLS